MATITQLKIRKPDDFHVHLREGAMLEGVLGHTANVFARGLVMPNLKSPVLIGQHANRYRDEIVRLVAELPGAEFEPLMTIKLTQETKPQDIEVAMAAGVQAVKLDPEGVTTNSTNGVSDIRKLENTLRAMQDKGMILCVHPEEPGVFCLDREAAYLKNLSWMIETFPNLKIVVEHVTSAEAVSFVKAAPANVAATITAHHLFITLDDVIGGMLNPHNFCKPVAKRPEDRSALLDAATSGSPKFFLGTDSAPHARETKEYASGCAGCFTAPLALPLLAELFERAGYLDRLEAFASEYGARFYGLPLNEGTLTLDRADWQVPRSIGTEEAPREWRSQIVVPFMAGSHLRWKVPEP